MKIENIAIQEALAEENEKPIKENIVVRLSPKEKGILKELMERLSLQQSAVMRVAIRALEKQTRGK